MVISELHSLSVDGIETICGLQLVVSRDAYTSYSFVNVSI